MTDDTAARLAAIGPYQDVSLDDTECVIHWDNLPALATGWARFGLEFRVESVSRGARVEPDNRLFAVWEAYRGRHPEAAEVARREVVERMRAEGVTGAPADHAHSTEVTVGVADGGYYVNLSVGLEFTEHGPVVRWDPESDEIDCIG